MAERAEPGRRDDHFATTQWSLVVRAGGDKSARDALAELCERYWYPVYAYVRRRTNDVHLAQDRTQEFFARMLEKNAIAAADPERGRFRAFLLTALKNFLHNAHEHSAAQKRGGGARPLSLDFDSGETRMRLEPAQQLTAEQLFERQWIYVLLETVTDRLQEEYRAAGKLNQWETLCTTLTGGGETAPFADLGAALGISADAARQAASRLRKRYREILRAEVASTIEDEGCVDDEIRRLFQVLAS